MFISKEVKKLKKKIESLEDSKQYLSISMDDMKADHRREIKDIELRHKFALQEETADLHDQLHKKEIQIAELRMENKKMKEIVDLNGDIVDVKNLVEKLIGKLSNIDLKSLTIQDGS